MKSEEQKKIDKVMSEVESEYKKAVMLHPGFRSPHEGLGILWEEFEELKAEVFKNERRRNRILMSREAKQVAAMAIRFMIDCGE